MKTHASKASAMGSRWKRHPTEQLGHRRVGVSSQQSSYCKPPHFRLSHQIGQENSYIGKITAPMT